MAIGANVEYMFHRRTGLDRSKQLSRHSLPSAAISRLQHDRHRSLLLALLPDLSQTTWRGLSRLESSLNNSHAFCHVTLDNRGVQVMTRTTEGHIGWEVNVVVDARYM